MRPAPYGLRQAGLVACLGSGLIEACGPSAPIGSGAGRRGGLLSTLAGIALGYIALGFLLRTYINPWKQVVRR